MASDVWPDAEGVPHAFIQWKGTDICMDFHCECGSHCHFDGYFAYTVRCPHCSTVWEMPQNVFPRKADESTYPFWRENPQELEADEDLETLPKPETDPDENLARSMGFAGFRSAIAQKRSVSDEPDVNGSEQEGAVLDGNA